jgi:SnoaL-like domain
MTMATYVVSAEERSQVEQALYAYCRGLDRFDREIALSAFSPEAVLNYSGIYVGDAPGFMDWVWPFHKKLELNIHRVANVFIDRNPSGQLVSETYVTSTLRRRDGAVYIDRVGYGRYIDRWARRDRDRLAIVERDFINDCLTELRNPAVAAPAVELVDEVSVLEARRDHEDASYRLFMGADVSVPATSRAHE